MSQATNSILTNGVESEFVLKNHIETIPRYILFDRGGKIIISDAPKPSDPELTELIDKNL